MRNTETYTLKRFSFGLLLSFISVTAYSTELPSTISAESADAEVQAPAEDTATFESPAAASAESADAEVQAPAEDTATFESPAAASAESVDAEIQAPAEDTATFESPAATSAESVDAEVQGPAEDTATFESPAAASAETVDADAHSSALASGIRRGDRRPEEQFTIDLFDRPLTIGGSLESLLGLERDLSFDETDDDLTFFGQSLSVELFYEISDSISFFADAALFYLKEQGEDETQLTGAERNQTWLLFEEIFNSKFDIKIGAQYFSDERAWWWDEDLDGISIQYWGDRWQGELGFTQGLARKSTTEDRLDPADEDLFRLLSRVSWELADDHWTEFFYVMQIDHSGTESLDTIIDANLEDDTDADLSWFGLRSYGYWETDRTGEIDYWLDMGYVDGDETFISTSEVDGGLVVDEVETAAIRGWAIDTGLTWHTELPLSPSFTLGYAVGSGKLDEDGFLDNAYQQTGIEGNSNYFADVNIVSYYGELLNPELSNLKIWTLGVSVPLLENSAIDLVYHQYDQYKATDFLRNAGIDKDPEGNNREIGQEIDIIMRVQEWVHWEYGFAAAFFKAGEAFESDSGEIATSLLFQLNYNF